MRPRKKLEMLGAQPVVFKPMLSQKSFPGGLVIGAPRVVGVHQIAHERQIVRKSLVGIEIQLEIQLRPDVTVSSDDVIEVRFEVAAREDFQHLAGELFELVVSLVAQVEPRELVVPGAIGKLLDGALVDFLFLRAQLILFEELRKAFVKAGIIRIAVHFAAKHFERPRELVQRGQTRKVALENGSIFRGARAARLWGLGGGD